MQKKYYLDKFFTHVKLKKQHIKKLKNKIILLNDIKHVNCKFLYYNFFKNKSYSINEEFLVSYILGITFYRTNTLLHLTDSSGELKFSCSAGSLGYKGKSKKSRFNVFRSFYGILLSKCKFLKNQPLALHLKNVGFSKFWIIRQLKKKFFIRTIKTFNSYPYNGCRKRKMRRKKFKKRRNG